MRVHAAAGLSLLVFVEACGGGLSKSQLDAKGDAICKRINTRMAKEPDPSTTADLQRLAKRTVELSDPAIDEMEALWAPIADHDEWTAFNTALTEIADMRQAYRATPAAKSSGRPAIPS